MILVLGAAGQVGSAFVRLLGSECVGLDRSGVDLSRIQMIRPVLERLRPTSVINCAAYTAVDRAESEADTAFLVNARAVEVLASVCADIGAGFLTFSTDFVFSGDLARPYLESDQVDPQNVYGASKALGERLALTANPASLIVRTSWVISASHRCFLDTMVRLGLQSGEKLKVVDDQFGRVTVASDLARASLRALTAGVGGLLHLSNPGEMSRYDLARDTFRLAGLDQSRIEPCASEEFVTPAKRPPRSILGSERLEGLGLPDLPPASESLPDVVEGVVARLSQEFSNAER